ncbi:PAAR domain-containing protein [Massilia sp. G4R7]|uniref:PAAR domain-containing protein n=1 Tax=Massilia phyllostachyos TaxID=2898585 RepID=A0ABS8QAA3_9BURK|nr:PAAR domain-containing protein [Massilia phyllostachyos]MCD2518670.1 PAAR domain-containing protein [Massilia phyllostachyos]
MPNVIRLGDPTSHGGKVVSASADYFTVDGKAVARVGDLCSCPIKGHDNCKIAEGSPGHVIDDKEVAYEGHKTTCGATLIATIGTFCEQ